MSILVVGGGKMGLSHMAILNRLMDKGSVAVCDPSRLSRFIFGRLGIATYRSLDDALKSPVAWRGAVIATPTSTHFPLAKTLLERRIPCFIEKPLTLNTAHSQILAELQRSSGTVVQMGLVTRFIQPFVQLRRITASGVLGRPLRYRARMLGNVVTKPDSGSWRTDFKHGGGCLNEYGPHLLDLCRAIFGDVQALDSARYGQVHSTRCDDSFDVAWTHTSGTSAALVLNWCDTTRRKSAMDFEAVYEHGVVHANNAELRVQIHDNAPLDTAQRAALQARVLPYPVNFYLRGEEFSLQLEVFLQQVMGRRLLLADIAEDSAASIQDGLAVDQLIQDIAAMGNLGGQAA